MKTALVLLISFGAAAFAQDVEKDSNANKNPVPESKQLGNKRRLQSVTWDLNAHKLVWVVQKGSEVNGKFVATSSDRYEIAPDKATMGFSDEKRGFTEDEAESLQHLLDVLSLYCAESTVWWDQGQGVPLDKNGVPTGPEKKPDAAPKSKRVEERPQQPKPQVGNLQIASMAR